MAKLIADDNVDGYNVMLWHSSEAAVCQWAILADSIGFLVEKQFLQLFGYCNISEEADNVTTFGKLENKKLSFAITLRRQPANCLSLNFIN